MENKNPVLQVNLQINSWIMRSHSKKHLDQTKPCWIVSRILNYLGFPRVAHVAFVITSHLLLSYLLPLLGPLAFLAPYFEVFRAGTVADGKDRSPELRWPVGIPLGQT